MKAYAATLPTVDNSNPIVSQPSANSSTTTPTLSPELLQQVIQALHTSRFGKATLSNTWIFDSGASNHMTGSLEFLKNVVPYNHHDTVRIANGQSLPVKKVRSLTIPLSDSTIVSLSNILYGPSFKQIQYMLGNLLNRTI